MNPVTENDDSVKKGLYTDYTDVPSNLKYITFKEILTTDATTEDGESEVGKYFGVQRQWNKLNEEWSEKQELIKGYKRYYKLLFLVKLESTKDHLWFSFFKRMHRHAAIVAGLFCSKFDHITNELKQGSLTLDDFKIDGAVKNFKDPGTTVEEHLDRVMAKEYEAPMFHNKFHVSAYIPKPLKMDANELIKAA